MSKSVVLVLEPNHESEYGEYANIPAFNAHGDIIGWTGGEVPESGHSCEFNVLNDEGFTTCASSTTVNKLRGENTKLRELVAEMYEAVKCCCDECWFGYGHNPAKCKNENCGYRKEYVAMRELGIEVD